jgi:hypothetical protein
MSGSKRGSATPDKFHILARSSVLEPIEIVPLSPPTQIGLKITYSRIRITTAVQPADVRNTVARDGI